MPTVKEEFRWTNYVTTKTFCSSKDSTKRVKRQPQSGRRCSQNLYQRTWIQNVWRTPWSFFFLRQTAYEKNGQKTWTFSSKEAIQKINKSMKSLPSLLVIREMQITATKWCYNIPTKYAKMEQQECGPVETLKRCWWNLKLIGPLLEICWVASTKA